MLAGLGTPEIAIIAGVIVLLFGAGALPKFAKSIGQAKKEFEKGVDEGFKGDSDKKEAKDDKESK